MPMLHFDLDELFEDLIPEEKSKKQNSTDTTHKEKNGGIGGEVPQAQKTQGFATPPNNSTESTISTKWVEKHTLEEHLSDLTEIEQLQLLIEDHWRKRLPGSFHVPIGYDIEVLHQRIEQKLDIWWGKEPGTQPMGIMIMLVKAGHPSRLGLYLLILPTKEPVKFDCKRIRMAE